MERKKLNNKLYVIENVVSRHREFRKKTLPDGCLFSGPYPTKIKPSDLPEWYVYGRYYKKWGYMCTKGISDLVYIPNRFVNHYLKDDFLLISFHDKIVDKGEEYISVFERYSGFDHYVYGSEIITILRGARKFSNYDISGFIDALKRKLQWCYETFPDADTPKDWLSVDVDKLFEVDDFYRPIE